MKLQSLELVVEFVAGKANVLADFASRVPISNVAGLYDDAAFDCSADVLPTNTVFAALEEYHDEYNRELASRKCPRCNGDQGFMLLCDRCGAAWHPGCAELAELPGAFWYCAECEGAIAAGNERDLCYDRNLLKLLEYGIVEDEEERSRLLRAA